MKVFKVKHIRFSLSTLELAFVLVCKSAKDLCATIGWVKEYTLLHLIVGQHFCPIFAMLTSKMVHRQFRVLLM